LIAQAVTEPARNATSVLLITGRCVDLRVRNTK
jgi:hypothetical protein